MSFSKIFLASACALVLVSCGSDNKGSSEPTETAALGDSDSAEQPAPLTFQIDEVTSWRGGAKAAYSIIHDDYPYLDGLPTHYLELNKRGLRAGLGVIVGAIEEGDHHYYDKLQQMVNEGHEVINHSYSHIDLTKENVDWDREIDHSTRLLREQKFSVSTFVFPFDQYNDAIFQRLKGLDYLGARGGRKDEQRVNSADMVVDDPLAPFRVRFDAFYEDPDTGKNTYSVYGAQDDVLEAYLDDAIQKGGWAVRELHGIEDSSWGSVHLAKYTAHLDYVAAKVKSNEVWMDTFSNVNRYRSSRAYCGEALVQDSAVTFSLSTSADCTKYATPLSVIVSADGVDSIKATQNGVDIPVKPLGSGKHILDIDPTAGPAYITGV
jgi:peptidoglycan/xylan/chitin deacetylase (PgdA/CDA1 family)